MTNTQQNINPQEIWQNCLNGLKKELLPHIFDTWIKPLHSHYSDKGWVLFAPNQYVRDEINHKFLAQIGHYLGTFNIEIGTGKASTHQAVKSPNNIVPSLFKSGINPYFTFENFVIGKSNQIAQAASLQVALNYHHQAEGFNPLFIYGGTGLGKTHLMHAVGNEMRKQDPHFKVLYLHSERFVNEMIRALQTNIINQFKENYRSLDALFVDDIQFFAGKERSQEELFHIFNALLESGKQMIFTCDQFPKGIEGLEARLKSRFGWGLTVAVEPPDLETRTAILLNKAAIHKIHLTSEVALFIAKRVTSNVRELEGSLKRVVASSQFMGREISIDLVKESLKDLISLQAKQVTIENIQKTVADYYKIKISALSSKCRSRNITRPRQLAMALAKKLTQHSLPEIGEAFGGRDHTTVLHACRVIAELKNSQPLIKQDYENLENLLAA